jgi:hypothetical protein
VAAEEDLPTERLELEPDLAPGMEPPEGEPTRRSVKRTPGAQDSIVPLGWKPTARKPIPVVRCVYIFKDEHPKAGDRCGQWSLRGSQLCFIHAGRGNLKNVEEYRQAILEAARLQLTEAVPDAMNGLIELSATANAENVRLKAYTEILDRAGIKTAEELRVDLNVTADAPAAVLAERVAKLKKAADLSAEMQRRQETAVAEQLALEAPAVSVITDTDGGDVIEGEVVDRPSPEQE